MDTINDDKAYCSYYDIDKNTLKKTNVFNEIFA